LSYFPGTITTDGSAEWTVSINATNSTASQTGVFYIVPTEDAFVPAGFETANNTAPSGAETNSFTTYGSVVMYSDNSTYRAQFWALATNNATDEWEILWNESGALQDGAVPVTLKTLAPTVSTDGTVA
jgi:hypothetical protein